ncbi:MAG: L,D-transpeptidase family protein [Tsuneonella sp.]
MTGIANGGSAAIKRAMLVCGAGALIALSAPLPAAAETFARASTGEVQGELADRAGDLRAVYAARQYRPLWLTADGSVSEAADILLSQVESARLDGLDNKALRKLKTSGVRRDLRRAADGDAEDIARADLSLSQLFAAYVRAMRGAHHADMIYENPALAPVVPTAAAALTSAAEARSLTDYVRQMGWMHPLYAPLREAFATGSFSPSERRVIWDNMDRVRALPATPPERYVLVDAANARLWMYEDGKPVDSMKVVVGKPDNQTPMMAGFIRYAILNPYWNVPNDITQDTIAANVLDRGTSYLRDRGYEVLTGYGPGATLLDPAKVDWNAVADGTQTVLVRQKPGGPNFMGKVKFEFPNPQGIYLHDTPARELLSEDTRQLSHGCVRLEDASRLGKFLFGKPLPKPGKQPERKVDLPTLVPVYITYLTARPSEQGIAFADDIYGRDSAMQVASAY